jgi:transglutaminase-like putative cysteine protease
VSFRALHKAVTYLISGLGLYALSLGGELDAVGLSLMTIGYAASWFAEGAPWHTSTTIHRGWTGAIVALFVLQLVRGFLFAVPAIPLGLEFLAFLIVSRLANRRSAAEYQQLGALNLLALIAGTLLSTELSYAFLFVGFLIVLPWVLALSHLRAEIDVHFGGLQRAGEKGPKKVQSQEDRRRLGRVLASKRVVTPAFLFRTARLTLPLFVFTAAVFVAFPRIGLGFLSFGLGVGQRASGFGANVELGDFGTIRTDPTVVLRVTPPDLSDTPPREVDFRLRGTSFDAYDGRRWTRRLPSDAPQRQRRRNDRYPIPVRYPIVGQDRPWRIILDHLEEPVMFLPAGTVGLSIPERLQSGFPVGRRIRLSPGMDVRYDADGNGLRYTAWVGAAPPEDSLTDVERRAYLAVPAGHERVAALAREWTEGADSDRERVARLLARLQSSSDFTYSLEMPAVGADALPLEVFLFEARRGHCEYFSTALAIQARTLGIPSRNVTGFLGGQWNAYGEYYSLRQGDAHSWVEVWIEGAGVGRRRPDPERSRAPAAGERALRGPRGDVRRGGHALGGGHRQLRPAEPAEPRHLLRPRAASARALLRRRRRGQRRGGPRRASGRWRGRALLGRAGDRGDPRPRALRLPRVPVDPSSAGSPSAGAGDDALGGGGGAPVPGPRADPRPEGRATPAGGDRRGAPRDPPRGGLRRDRGRGGDHAPLRGGPLRRRGADPRRGPGASATAPAAVSRGGSSKAGRVLSRSSGVASISRRTSPRAFRT